MAQPSPRRYIAVIERIPDIGKRQQALFRYSICRADTGEVVYEGHADDTADADVTARAHISFLSNPADAVAA